MKVLFFMFLQFVAVNAMAASMTVKIGALQGSIETQEDIRIQSVTVALSVNQHLIFEAGKDIKTKSEISEDKKMATFTSKAGSFKKHLYFHTPGNSIECAVAIKAKAKLANGKVLEAYKTVAKRTVTNLNDCLDDQVLTDSAQRVLEVPLNIKKDWVAGEVGGKEFLYIEN